MFDQIDTLRKLVDERRKLQPELMMTLEQKFREEWTYHSNAIEGNTFTYQETAFFLRESLTVKGKLLSEHLEIVNHSEAIDYLHDVIQGNDLSEGLIKGFHISLFQGERNLKFIPGDYKMIDNHVILSGTIHHYTPAAQVQLEMERLMHWYINQKEKMHTIELAAVFHYMLTAIHPFVDGNGRVSRLAMNAILIKNGFPPAIIRKEKCNEYYNALQKADLGDHQLIIDHIAAEVKFNLELILSV